MPRARDIMKNWVWLTLARTRVAISLGGTDSTGWGGSDAASKSPWESQEDSMWHGFDGISWGLPCKETVHSKQKNGACNLLWLDQDNGRMVGAEAGKSGQDQPDVPSVPHIEEHGFCSTGSGSTWGFSGEKLHKISIWGTLFCNYQRRGQRNHLHK